jgi:hypothetical protein
MCNTEESMRTNQGRYIYRTSIRLRDGRRIYAWHYGLKAFRIKIADHDPDQPKLPGL